MIQRYNDFELHLTVDKQQLIIDINGRPTAINLSQPVKVALKAYLSKQETFKQQFAHDIVQLGYELYNLVFQQEVLGQFKAYLNRRKQDEGVRICINIPVGLLSDAIWEILCDKTSLAPNFLALNPRTPVVRITRIGSEVYLRPMYLPLKVLVVLASPRHVEAIDPLVEKATIEQAISQAKAKRHIIVHYLGFDNPKEASFDRLQEHLANQEKPYDIVHVIGHGLLETDEEGITAFVEQERGTQEDVRASSLANLFRSRGVMLVILQSCQSGAVDPFTLHFSSAAQRLVAAGIPAVLAMQEKVDQDVARYFMERLYAQWLNMSSPFEDALTQARQSVYQKFPERESVWAIPVLYICPGVYLQTSKTTRKTVSTERLLDAALPRSIKMDSETELLTMIRTPTSPGLQEMLNFKPQIYEAKAKDVLTSSSFEISFPIDEATEMPLPKDVQIIVESNDFDISNPRQKVQVRPQGDSVFYVFRVIPKHKGLAKLTVSVVDTTEEPTTFTQLRLMATIRNGKSFKSPYQVVSDDQNGGKKVKVAKRKSSKNFPETVKTKPRPDRPKHKKDYVEESSIIESQIIVAPEHLYESMPKPLDKKSNSSESAKQSLDSPSPLLLQLTEIKSILQSLTGEVEDFFKSPLRIFPPKAHSWQLNMQSAIEKLGDLPHDIKNIDFPKSFLYSRNVTDIQEKLGIANNIFDDIMKTQRSDKIAVNNIKRLFDLYSLLANCEEKLDEIIIKEQE